MCQITIEESMIITENRAALTWQEKQKILKLAIKNYLRKRGRAQVETIRQPHHYVITIKVNSMLSFEDYNKETDKNESPDIKNIDNKSTSDNENTNYERTNNWNINSKSTDKKNYDNHYNWQLKL